MTKKLFHQWLIVTSSFILCGVISSLLICNNISLDIIFISILPSLGYGMALYNNKNEFNKNK
jgi:hypothetical protein